MKTATVGCGTVRSAASRLDAPFYLSDAVAYYNGLKRCPYETTAVATACKEVFFGNIFSRCFVKDAKHGKPYLRASEIEKADLHSGGLYLATRQADALKHLWPKRGMILVTCSGSLGRCAYADARFEEFIATHDLVRIVPDENGPVNPGTLYAFLASKYGYAALTHSQYGSVILHTNPEQIKSIVMPVFPADLQRKVDALVKSSARKREEADAALKKAVAHFDRYRVEKQPTRFVKKLSQIGFSWAADNNNLDCDAIRAKYAGNSVTIGELSKRIFLPPLFKHIYLQKDNGYAFYTGREMAFQNQRPYRWLSPLGVRRIEDYVVHKGTLLVYKSGVIDGGMYGTVVITDDNLDGKCLSNHVARITPNSMADACWMYAFLKSPAGFKLLQSLAIGTAIPEMTPKHIGNLPIPRPDENAGKIKDLVTRYIDCRVAANNAENEAIGIVEREIASFAEGGK